MPLTSSREPPQVRARPRPRARPRLLGVAVLLALQAGPAQARDAPLEFDLKAAFLVNFARFVEWPETRFADPAGPFLICVVGQDPFGGELEKAVLNRSIAKHPLAIRRFSGAAPELKNCPLVFVTLAQRRWAGEILAAIGDASVLTVGDAEDFILRGGAIRFFSREGKLRFEVNLAATDRARLKVSSKLLALARVVGGGGRSRW